MAESHGWKNNETRFMNLWIDNDQGLYEMFREDAQMHIGQYTVTEAKRALADQMEEYMEESMPDLGATVWADFLGASFRKVDWREIASAYIDNVE